MRYFFHTADGSRQRDTEGIELPNHSAARREAIRFIGECLHDQPELLSGHTNFRVEVTGRDNMMLFKIIALAVNAPAAGNVQQA
ncbi:DUF6894 family protein [Sphingomonas nostoxanthinifaciens]|uniref:DUF6894 family protein n=1 Tax=Sphingomonas nostoxanthinifaciens TaxID=2872652 RepID=UPI001CC217C9|nr:hypothetical protein [Sphingomonas nostoxanthinifaciens]UAK25709.1 hypothetical protein K8P63_06125 [Sphingomonas nostoxanthinifaciens]